MDWNHGTADLTSEQRGYTADLVMHQAANGWIPADDASIAKLIRVDVEKWMAVREPVTTALTRILPIVPHTRHLGVLMDRLAPRRSADD